MKVVHICMQDFGGAGTAAYRVHKALLLHGMDSVMYVAERWRNDPSVRLLARNPADVCYSSKSHGRIVPTNVSWPSTMQQWGNLRQAHPNHDPALEIFTDAGTQVDLSACEEIHDADIIQLHWVAGLVDFASGARVLHGKPIVWRFSDLNPFTGGCHYARGCERFTASCGACPQLGSKNEKDISRLNWLHKMSSYQRLDITGVAPSQWVAGEAQRSTLFGGRPVHVVTNCVPLDTFSPCSQVEARRRLGLPEDRFVILFGASHIGNERKGFRHVLQAIRLLEEQNTEGLMLVSFGSAVRDTSIKGRIPWQALPFLDSDEALRLAYAAADVFLVPSLEENLPSVALESLACGVPVVGFASGGIPEIIAQRETGYLVSPGDAKGLQEGIMWAKYMRDTGRDMRQACRQWAEDRFSETRLAQEYAQVYAKAIDRFQKKHAGRSETARSKVRERVKAPEAGRLQVRIACYEEVKAWILGKFASKLQDELVKLDCNPEIGPRGSRLATVTHHIPYLGWTFPRTSAVETLMITHVDTAHKLNLLAKQLALADMGICMSSDSVAKLAAAGVPRERLCWISPAHDGVVAPRKIWLGITSRLYDDARKRENYLLELLADFDPSDFGVRIMGAGWGSIVEQLRARNVEVSYWEDFDYEEYRNLFSGLDYYLYFGMDEGSMGFLDALAAGVATVVTPQGFHLDVPGGIDYAFITEQDLRSVLHRMAEDRRRRRKSVSEWTWERYARKHFLIWQYLLESKSADIQRAVHGFYVSPAKSNAANEATITLQRSPFDAEALACLAREALSVGQAALAKHFARKALVYTPTAQGLEEVLQIADHLATDASIVNA